MMLEPGFRDIKAVNSGNRETCRGSQITDIAHRLFVIIFLFWKQERIEFKTKEMPESELL